MCDADPIDYEVALNKCKSMQIFELRRWCWAGLGVGLGDFLEHKSWNGG